jgi:hypothetical protein
MKLDQICLYAKHNWQIQRIKEQFGLLDAFWIVDKVEMLNRLPPSDEWHAAIAELNFCEKLGIQFEIMRFTQGPHWHMFNDESIFISHIGLHVEDWPVVPHALLVQETRTLHHSAPAFHNIKSSQYGRRYEYQIYEIAPLTYIKLIKRIQHVPHP